MQPRENVRRLSPASSLLMPTTIDLAHIAEEAAALPAEKQSEILDFVLFVKGRVEHEDAAWERTLADARPPPVGQQGAGVAGARERRRGGGEEMTNAE